MNNGFIFWIYSNYYLLWVGKFSSNSICPIFVVVLCTRPISFIEKKIYPTNVDTLPTKWFINNFRFETKQTLQFSSNELQFYQRNLLVLSFIKQIQVDLKLEKFYLESHFFRVMNVIVVIKVKTTISSQERTRLNTKYYGSKPHICLQTLLPGYVPSNAQQTTNK